MTNINQKLNLKVYPKTEWRKTEKGKKYMYIYLKNWRLDHPEKLQEQRQKEYQTAWLKYQNLREKIIVMLNGKCIKCGYIGPALQIDHIKNNGSEERKKHGTSLAYLYRILKKIKAGSKDYQLLLCANCNWEKRISKCKKYL